MASKLNRETNLIIPLKSHNHNVEKYKTVVYQLKTKFKTMSGIRKLASEGFLIMSQEIILVLVISLSQNVSHLYRARRIPQV